MATFPYQANRHLLNSESGMERLLDVERSAREHILKSGAVISARLLSGDSWLCLNAMDFLEERGVLRQVTGPDVAGQCRVYVAGDKF